MAGGDAGAFDAASDAFTGMGALSKRMGGPGAGAAAKLINQLLYTLPGLEPWLSDSHPLHPERCSRILCDRTACNAHAASEALALARALDMKSPAEIDELCAVCGWVVGNPVPTEA